MKIKQEKQLTLPQLLEYAWENNVKGETFFTLKNGMKNVHFNTLGSAEFSDVHQFSSNDYFTVEIEEELTEYTVIPKLMTTFKKTYLENGFGYQRARIDEDYTIKLMLDKAGMHGEPVKTLHIVNDDGTHTLIWTHDKGLVE